MTDTPTTDTAASTPDAAPAPARRTGGALGGKVLAELQEIAAGLGIGGAKKMRKGELIDAIKAARGDAPAAAAAPAPAKGQHADRVQPDAAQAVEAGERSTEQQAPLKTQGDALAEPRRGGRGRGAGAAKAKTDEQGSESKAGDQGATKAKADDQGSKPKGDEQQAGGAKAKADDENDKSDKNDKNGQNGKGRSDEQGGRNRGGNDRGEGGGQQGGRNRGGNRGGDSDRDDQGNRGGRGRDDRGNDQNRDDQGGRGNDQRQDAQDNRHDDDDEAGGGRRRNRRGRNRGSNRGPEGEPTYTEDDVLVPAAGILDILDNYAFVRTTGYLPSENDVYVSLSMVRKWGLRKGDAVTGQVRQPREGERKEKFNPMVRIDTVNGMTLEESRTRVDFGQLTPLFPTERLRLETDADNMTTRIIDLMSPIGKGQRGLIVSPPKAGKTMVMQAVANAITTNNPECHLMVVLVDERPEEVTEMQRTVKGEVIASTFDRPASDHTTVAELAIERAKRLVELGHDVVVLLDSITRLGRAYNLSAPASGRIMSGGVDSSALYPPKKFFGAARNIEDGGSLTILATALVETGSRMDEVIFEEFKGTGNMELRLRRDLADKRIFPAIDVEASSTRREELLMDKDELAVVWKLRRVLSGLEGQQGIELMLERLKKSESNLDFLRQINTTMPQTSNGTKD